jgi:hypothetical protein
MLWCATLAMINKGIAIEALGKITEADEAFAKGKIAGVCNLRT